VTRPAQKPQDGRDTPRGRERQEAANGRTRRAEQAARALLRDGPITRATPAGVVQIEGVEISIDETGLMCLEVVTAPGAEGETSFRIFNPPTGVRRSDGTIEEDPVGALIQVLAAHGAAKTRRRRR
jgi:hypothetical protein